MVEPEVNGYPFDPVDVTGLLERLRTLLLLGPIKGANEKGYPRYYWIEV
jgi:hypothetical protein